MSRLCCAPHPSYSSPFIVVRSLWTAAAFSCSFFFIITHIHLCIPAANLVPMADGLGLRVVSTALRLRAYYISLSTAPVVVYSAAEVSKVPQLDINLVSGHLHSPHRGVTTIVITSNPSSRAISRGIQNVKVFPAPVSAQATTSLPTYIACATLT